MSESEPESSTTWDGYTDYQHVSGRVSDEIHDAFAAAGFLSQFHQVGGEYEAHEIASASARLISAAYMVDEQLDYFSNGDDEYQEILDEWRGEDGRIQKLHEVDWWQEHPDWLVEFVRELHRAGLMLGYLKSGREEEDRDEGESTDSEVRQVIEEMTV